MSTGPETPTAAVTAPPEDGWQQLRANLDQHIFFWIMLLIALYIFCFVPQVTNVWRQGPPVEGGWLTMTCYLIFLTFLIGFYLLSMFVVIRRFPAKWVQDWVEKLVSRRMEAWQKLGPRRFYHPSYVLAAITWRSPDLCCRWLVWTVSNPKSKKTVPMVALIILVAVLIGLSALVFGTRSDASRLYPLAGAFCQNMALLSLAAFAWLLMAIPPRMRGAPKPGEVWLHFGRFIAWLISTAAIGELLWLLAYSNWWDNLISYRLYSIWAIIQLLTTLVIAGLLIDRWHDSTDRWPVRQFAVVLLPLFIWLFTRSLPVSTADLDRHLTPDQVIVWRDMCKKSDDMKAEDDPREAAWHGRSNTKWFTYLNRRVQEVPEFEPVVIVAASGGGSRAAIFTALVLETLARTPTYKDPKTGKYAAIDNATGGAKQRTWADNVVLISSVSGGSLATAHHVERRRPQTPPESVPVSPHSHKRVLLNTEPEELKHWGLGYASELIKAHLDDPLAGFPVDLLRDYFAKEEDTRKNSKVAVEALEKAAPDLQKLLDTLLEERETKEEEMTPEDGSLPRDAEKLAEDVQKLTETIEALRRALALLEGYRSLKRCPNVKDPVGRWIWTSKAFDEMCIDFMAPITRGAMTPALDRGDALARFWTHRYQWYDCTNFSGYHGSLTDWNYDPDPGTGERRPAVVFNAVDVARGSRLMVGFPPLPSDFWNMIYQRGVTREVPRALNAPVSLARAVRMSSNFPYGFRAMEFQVPRADPESASKRFCGSSELDSIHVLDGGVVDNTGLDTVYEVLIALEHHADPKKRSPYLCDASDLLANLRRHGVCVLEIDAGAKPNTKLPARFNPFGGITEQSQAMENGGYSNADRAKQFYLKEIRRILSQKLDEPGQILTGGPTSLRDLEEGLRPTAFHHCFTCNHYQPGRAADPAIMTAWALGPRDKAEVVARCLPEVGMWDQQRIQMWDDISTRKKLVNRARQVARRRVLVDRLVTLDGVFEQLGRDLAELEGLGRSGEIVAPVRILRLRAQLGEAQKQLAPLIGDLDTVEDDKLRAQWTKLRQRISAVEQLLARFEDAQTPERRAQLRAKLNSDPDLGEHYQVWFKQFGTGLQEAEAAESKQVIAELQQEKLLNRQHKYDVTNRQGKEVEKKSSMREE